MHKVQISYRRHNRAKIGHRLICECYGKPQSVRHCEREQLGGIMFLIAIAIILATILVFKGVRIFNYIDHMAGIMEMIPGPTPYPFVGNLFQFGLSQPVSTDQIACLYL